MRMMFAGLLCLSLLYADASPAGFSELEIAQTGWISTLLNGPEDLPSGSRLILCLCLIALATLVTEDLACVTTGLMIANGTITWAQGVGACLFGILVGDFLLFIAGKKWGRPALRRAPLRWMIHPLKLIEAEEWFRQRGGVTILIARFLPGTRLPVYVSAGLMGVSYVKFAVYFTVAALIWTPALVFLAYKLAGKALRWVEDYQHLAPWVLLGLVLAYVLILKVLVPLMSWRGRRQWVGRWRRWTRPEYWPSFLLYFPVGVVLLLRGLRKGKHPLDFSACNPCIPGSGVVEESKSEILDQITDREAVADYAVLPKEECPARKCERVDAFMAERNLSFPVVIKPDVGQRGNQVMIAKSREAVEEALKNVHVDFMVQTYVPGVEFGVFYIRHPEAKKGRIFAITRKTFCTLVGDGVHNLEELILGDKRAVCQAKVHFQHLQSRLFEVPEEGERIQLTQVGNHARGTLFQDGICLHTPELEARIEAVSQSLPGFYFGRYDLMAPDEESFRRGKGLRIIELNGVSSEATSMYDPKKSYFAMVKTLCTQWREASAIGRVLQLQGHPRMKMRELIQQYDQYLLRENRRHLSLNRKAE